jgi:hypothetical protein
MQRLTRLLIAVLTGALLSTASAQVKRVSVDSVEHSLGRFVAVGASCPKVSSYSAQIQQKRALDWSPARAEVEARIFTSERVNDRQSRLRLRDCTASASKALPQELLGAASRDGETALIAGINQCLRDAGGNPAVVDVTLRRSAPICE